jgi:hypothetical protein
MEDIVKPLVPRADLVNAIIKNPDHSHSVFGCFGKPGHYTQEAVGRFSAEIKHHNFHLEREYTELFGYDVGGEEFIARVHGKPLQNTDFYKLTLSYNDRRGDKRPGSHTDYILLLFGKDSIKEIVPAIDSDLPVMIDLFRHFFPTYDRSSGRLRIDSNKPGKIILR